MATIEREPICIRMNPELYHQVKIASVIARKTAGSWIEEALLEKLNRECPHIALMEFDSGPALP